MLSRVDVEEHTLHALARGICSRRDFNEARVNVGSNYDSLKVHTIIQLLLLFHGKSSGREIDQWHGCFDIIVTMCLYVEEHGCSYATCFVTGNLR